MSDNPETFGRHSEFNQVGGFRTPDGPGYGAMRQLVTLEIRIRQAFYAIHGGHATPWPGRHRSLGARNPNHGCNDLTSYGGC